MPHKKIEALCERFAAAFPLRGHAVLQFLVDARGKIGILECNARFGGASTASIAAGLDSFYWLMLETAGGDAGEHPFVRAKEEIRQVRFPDDFIMVL